MNAHLELIPWFLGTWIVLGILSVWLLQFNRNVAQKKRLIPPFIVGTSILFTGFVVAIFGSLSILWLVAPVVLLITVLNLRNIRVCESCGRTVHNNLVFSKMEYCPKCGVKLPPGRPG